MKTLHWQEPNVTARAKAKEINGETWEMYRADIVREFLSGGAQGYAKALRWIQLQDIPGFSPTLVTQRLLVCRLRPGGTTDHWLILYSAKQVRHRIKEIWKEATSPIASTPHHIECHIPERADTHGSLDGLSDTEHQTAIAPSIADLESSSNDVPFWPDASGEEALGGPQKTLVDPKLEEKPQELPSSSLTLHPLLVRKRSAQSQDPDTQRATKRQDSGHSTETTTDIKPENTSIAPNSTFHVSTSPHSTTIPNISLPNQQLHIEDDISGTDHAWNNTHTLEPSLARKCDARNNICDSSNAGYNSSSEKAASSTQLDIRNNLDRHCLSLMLRIPAFSPKQSFAPFRDTITDPVMEPSQLQRLLAKIGIDWTLEAVTQWLEKDVVLPRYGELTVPNVKYTKSEIYRVQAFGEVLFASLNLEEAFPLFLQSFLAQKTILGHLSAKTLTQCAQSANSDDDRLLLMAVLEKEALPVLDSLRRGGSSWPLVRAEITGILHSPEYQAVCNARCSNNWSAYLAQLGLPDMLNDPGQVLSGHEFHRQAFDNGNLAPFKHEAPYIRQCLQHAARVFAGDFFKRWRTIRTCHMLQLWPESSRTAELAIFTLLLESFTDAPQECSESLSTVEILSVIAFLVLGSCDGTDPFYVHFGAHFRTRGTRKYIPITGIEERTSALLAIELETLLFGFRSCSVERNRIAAREGLNTSTMKAQYTELIANVFAGRDHLRIVAADDFKYPCLRTLVRTEMQRPRTTESLKSNNPTLARSLSTTSTWSATWSSMRRISRITHNSSSNRGSQISDLRKSIDELSERASILTISDQNITAQTAARDLFGLNEESSSSLADSLVFPITKPPVPKFSASTSGNPRISRPTPIYTTTTTVTHSDPIQPRAGGRSWI